MLHVSRLPRACASQRELLRGPRGHTPRLEDVHDAVLRLPEPANAADAAKEATRVGVITVDNHSHDCDVDVYDAAVTGCGERPEHCECAKVKP